MKMIFENVKHRGTSVTLSNALENEDMQFQHKLFFINRWRSVNLFYLQGLSVEEKVYIDNIFYDFFYYTNKVFYLGRMYLFECEKRKAIKSRKQCIREIDYFAQYYLYDLLAFVKNSNFETDVKYALKFFINDMICLLCDMTKK